MSATIGHLFVYGTLMRGGVQERLAGGGSRIPATLRGHLYALPAGYPALALDPGADWVHGELVELLDPRLLALLDRYEGVDDGLFRRVRTAAVVGLRQVPAWAWVMDDPAARGGRRLPSGRWKPRRRRIGR